MGIPHFSYKYGSRESGSSAASHFNYICRLDGYEKKDLVKVIHCNYPGFAASNPRDFWQATDLYERANARLYREFEIALPRELSRENQLELISQWADSQIGKSHPYTVAIHEPTALDGSPNCHAHVMFCERTLDGIERGQKLFFKRANSKNPELGGAKKNKVWKQKQKLIDLRESWEKAHNLALERAGIASGKISMKSLIEQGIDRMPEPKLGARQTAMLKQGRENDNTRLVQALREVRQLESSLKEIHQEINQTIYDLAQEAVSNSPLKIPANEIKAEVREHKMELYARLREVERDRYSLGLLHTAQGSVYSKSSDPIIRQQRVAADKQYKQLNKDILKAKKFEKNLALLGSIEIAVKKGNPLSKAESLCNFQGFMQKAKEAQALIWERNKNINQIQLMREVPPP